MFKFSCPESGNIFYATRGSVGFDIHANENILLLPNKWHNISTGLYILETYFNPALLQDEIPEIQIRSRSGLVAKHGIVVHGGIATIDPDYLNQEIKVTLYNSGSNSYLIQKGDRIAQGICAIAQRIRGIQVKQVERNGGHGSTGR